VQDADISIHALLHVDIGDSSPHAVIPQEIAVVPKALNDGGRLSGHGKTSFFLNGIIVLPMESRKK